MQLLNSLTSESRELINNVIVQTYKAMLRNIFAFEDEFPDWQQVLSTFETKVPRFDTKEEAQNFTKEHCLIGSNPDYPVLQHSVTTLVSWQQIETYLLPKIQEYDQKYALKTPVPEEESLQSNRYLNCEREEDKTLHEYITDRLNLKIHQSLSYESRNNTLRYLFFHMKCGIYVMIRENSLKIFAPFVNKDYENTWSDSLHLDCQDNTVESYIDEKARNLHHKKEILLPKNKWWANGNIICNSNTSSTGEVSTQIWGDHFLFQLKDMFSELCLTRTIPDCEFFINKRDYPQLKIDGKGEEPVEPYGFIFDRDDRDPSEDIPLARHHYQSYAPILSFYLSKRFADIPIPPTEDWETATGKIYPASFKYSIGENNSIEVDKPRDFFSPANMKAFDKDWSEKVPTAFFRGTATGGGVTAETNQRIKIAAIHHEWSKMTDRNGKNPAMNDGFPFLDAKVTGWNKRDKKIASTAMTYVQPEHFPFDGRKAVNFVPIYQQAQYKYLVYVEGHCAACRYGFMMSLGSVILKVESTCVADQMWYFPLLQPFVDHIPIKADYSDLYEKLLWCHEHDEECARIAANAKAFYQKYISKEGILDYLQCICLEIAKRWKSVPSFLLNNSWTKNNKSWIPTSLPVPTIPRKYTDQQLLQPHSMVFCAKAKTAGQHQHSAGGYGYYNQAMNQPQGVLCTYCSQLIEERKKAEELRRQQERGNVAEKKEKGVSLRKRMKQQIVGTVPTGEMMLNSEELMDPMAKRQRIEQDDSVNDNAKKQSTTSEENEDYDDGRYD